MSESDQSGAGRREVAYRLFAAEFDDADFSYSESDEERAPNYVITPTGARVNRLFVVGVLTEVEEVSEDVLRARVVDPTGAFVLYAGQYQPDEQAFLDSVQTPTFVAVTGKARTFQPEDSSQVFTSVRPETISEVDATTRDRWTVQTAEQTIRRIGQIATALSLGVRGDDLRATLADDGLDEGLAAGIPLALEHYDTTPSYLDALRDVALDTTRLVAGDVDEVEGLSLAPDDGGDAALDALADADVEPTSVSGTASTEATATSEQSTTEQTSTVEATSDGETTSTAAVQESADVDADTATTDDEEEETEPATATASAGGTESAGDGGSSGTETADMDDNEDIGDFEPGEFELDEDEREEIESEYGTEFQSGTEVPDPGEADIETPDPEEVAEEQPESESTATTTEPTTDAGAAATESDEEPAESDQTADAEDVDLEDAAVEAMDELDDGDGADRDAVVATLVERHGADESDVEDAIQDALMGGRCYEPDDTSLKPI